MLLAPWQAGRAQPPAPAWDTYSDTWVGADALGRKLPVYESTGPPRRNKTLGMFYFQTSDSRGDGPYDNTQILKAHPEAMLDAHNPAWGPPDTSHYWGEPLFGYYVSDDEWVVRKHAYMLANAGVDVVIFDNSNAVTYDKARNTLCKVWEDIRHHGGKTPQIAFLCPFGGSIGPSTLKELYDTVYAKGLYSDLWFRWDGKPLVLGSESYAEGAQDAPTRQPSRLESGSTLGQTFTAGQPFTEAGGDFPTWSSSGSGMTLSLYEGGPGGRRLASHQFVNVKDNASLLIGTGKTLPAGKYYLEMSNPVGTIGWWGNSTGNDSGAFEEGTALTGDRTLRVHFAGKTQAELLDQSTKKLTPGAAAEAVRNMREFFTFRSPIPEYNNPAPQPGSWGWLQIHPQAPQLSPSGNVEQITVGVAQNYNASANRTAPMSFPGAFGRSYHAGKEETGPGAVRQGYNFAEQWTRALQVDPPFVFVTGWNEWTAGFYQSWAGYNAPPAIFVDEFTEEYSRDIEPMKNDGNTGHGDDYYYQLVSSVRHYKGVRPLPPVTPRPIAMNGRFSEWKNVQPEFRDAIGDTAHRNSPGVGKAGPYINTSGRNDIAAAKVSYDAKNVYFYVRTQEKLTPHTDPDWMLLYINVDANYQTGWLGYDFVVNRKVGEAVTSLEKNIGGTYQWQKVATLQYRMKGAEMEIAVPRAALGLTHLPAAIDFKWADHCFSQGDWTDFTLRGDAAPDDRFNYRAKLQGSRPR